MKKIFFSVIIQMILFNYGIAQTFQMDTILYKGNINQYINIVIMGDGYTVDEQNKFISDARNLSNYLFVQSPWSNYLNYFNVFAIKVISTQSGTRHLNTASDCNSASPLVPVFKPNTYFGCSFDAYGIHRLVVPSNTSNIANVLATNFPGYDQVLIVANTPYYGGSGGSYATGTVNTYSNEIMAHEIGHSFAYLADEYYAGDIYFAEKANMTQQTNPALVKWKNWLGYNGVDIYQYCCGGNSALWYKPHTSCKMQVLGKPYCSVCTEAIIERIHSLVNPIVSYIPATLTINSPSQFIDFKLTELMKPITNTLNIVWKLDGVTVLNNIDSIKLDQNSLTNGMHTLAVNVVDTTRLLRVDNHSTQHINTVIWTINKTITGIKLTSTDNKITFSVYPNPSSNVLNVLVEIEKKSKLSIQIISLEGKIIKQLANETLVDGSYLKTFNIEHLTNGTYSIVIKLGDIIHTQTFIKQ